MEIVVGQVIDRSTFESCGINLAALSNDWHRITISQGCSEDETCSTVQTKIFGALSCKLWYRKLELKILSISIRLCQNNTDGVDSRLSPTCVPLQWMEQNQGATLVQPTRLQLKMQDRIRTPSGILRADPSHGLEVSVIFAFTSKS